MPEPLDDTCVVSNHGLDIIDLDTLPEARSFRFTGTFRGGRSGSCCLGGAAIFTLRDTVQEPILNTSSSTRWAAGRVRSTEVISVPFCPRT